MLLEQELGRQGADKADSTSCTVWCPSRFNCLTPFEDIATLVFRALSFDINYSIKTLDL